MNYKNYQDQLALQRLSQFTEEEEKNSVPEHIKKKANRYGAMSGTLAVMLGLDRINPAIPIGMGVLTAKSIVDNNIKKSNSKNSEDNK